MDVGMHLYWDWGPVSRKATTYTYDNINIELPYREISIPRVGNESTTQALESGKAVHILDSAATAIACVSVTHVTCGWRYAVA
jgi:hypothetical protein